MNKTYTQETTASAIVQDLLNIFGIEVGTFELVEDKTYPRGRVCKGKLKDVITEIVVSDCKSRFLIRDGRIIINDPAAGVSSGYTLSAETGLLRADDDESKTEIETDLTTQMTPGEKDEDAQNKTRQCLLNYHIGAADEITIQSKTLNGKYLVVRGNHKGSKSGDWITEIEVKPA